MWWLCLQWYVTARPDMSQLPGMSSAIQHCFEAAAVEPEALQHLDLYSCFPCVVQVRSHHARCDLWEGLSQTRLLRSVL